MSGIMLPHEEEGARQFIEASARCAPSNCSAPNNGEAKMQQLLSSECWVTTGGYLIHGTVIKHEPDKGRAIVCDDDKITHVIPDQQATTSILKAIRDCRNNADYWESRATMLEHEERARLAQNNADMQNSSDA